MRTRDYFGHCTVIIIFFLPSDDLGLCKVVIMQSLVVLLLFAGMVMVMHGIYEERLIIAKKDVKIEYRFVPRTYYEEQLSGNDLSPSIKTLFTAGSADPWADTSIGKNIGDTITQRKLSKPSDKT